MQPLAGVLVSRRQSGLVPQSVTSSASYRAHLNHPISNIRPISACQCISTGCRVKCIKPLHTDGPPSVCHTRHSRTVGSPSGCRRESSHSVSHRCGRSAMVCKELVGLLALCALSVLAAGEGSVADRAACPFQQTQRTFNGVTILVAEDRERSPCGPGLRCQPFKWDLEYSQNGRLLHEQVAMSWLCAADIPAVAADADQTLLETREPPPR